MGCSFFLPNFPAMLQKPDELTSIKVGVMVPQSGQYPQVGPSYLRGIQLYFTLHPNSFGSKSVELLVEDIGMASEGAVGAKFQPFAAQQVQALLGWCQDQVAEQVGGYAQMAGIPLVVTNLGEIMPSTQLPWGTLYRLGGGMWQAAHHLGAYFHQHEAGAPAVFLDFHDSGYDTPLLFHQAAQRSREVTVPMQVTGLPGDRGLSPTQAWAQWDQQAVVPTYGYHPKAWDQAKAEHLPKATKHYQLPHPLPLYEQGEMISADGWTLDEAAPEAVKFRQGCQEYFQQAPNPFLTLGYDTGAWLYAWAQHIEDQKAWGDRTKKIEGWGEVSFKSVRGPLHYDADRQVWQPGIRLFSQQEAEVKVLDEVAADQVVLPSDEAVTAAQTQDKSRFMNPYLVI